MLAFIFLVPLVWGFIYFNDIIWSGGNEIIMTYNIDVRFDSDRIELVECAPRYSCDTADNSYIGEKIIVQKSVKEANIWINKSIETFQIEFFSTAVAGGSDNLWDVMDMVEVSINNTTIGPDKDDLNIIKYDVAQSNGGLQIFDVKMFFKDDFLFAKKQELNSKIVVHWVNTDELDNIRKQLLLSQGINSKDAEENADDPAVFE